MAAYKLVLIRHGESCWNQENRFCGWFDADLSETGVEEAKRGGQALKGDFEEHFFITDLVIFGMAMVYERPYREITATLQACAVAH